MQNFEEQMGLPARRPTEAEILTEQGLEISKERLLDTLTKTEAYLSHERYSCIQRVGACSAACSQLRIERICYVDKRASTFIVHRLGEVAGPAFLLCAA